MTIKLQPGTPADAGDCGAICHAAFDAVCTRHGFPPDFPSVEAAVGLMSMLLGHPRIYSVLAEQDGRIVGSNFLDERGSIHGIGPIRVDPTGQNRGMGGRLMQNVIDRSTRQGAAGVRLLQAAFHNRSLCLYSVLGFRAREPASIAEANSTTRSRRSPRRWSSTRAASRAIPPASRSAPTRSRKRTGP